MNAAIVQPFGKVASNAPDFFNLQCSEKRWNILRRGNAATGLFPLRGFIRDFGEGFRGAYSYRHRNSRPLFHGDADVLCDFDQSIRRGFSESQKGLVNAVHLHFGTPAIKQ